MNTLTRNIQTFFTDKHGKIVIGQFPNVPLAIWIVCTILVYIISLGTLATTIQYIGCLALAVWAILEIRTGVNPFRRTLGVLVLVSLIIGLFL